VIAFCLKSLTICLPILTVVNFMEFMAEVLKITAGGRRIAILGEESARFENATIIQRLEIIGPLEAFK
jgi:hypothetical protein